MHYYPVFKTFFIALKLRTFFINANILSHLIIPQMLMNVGKIWAGVRSYVITVQDRTAVTVIGVVIEWWTGTVVWVSRSYTSLLLYHIIPVIGPPE